MPPYFHAEAWIGGKNRVIRIYLLELTSVWILYKVKSVGAWRLEPATQYRITLVIFQNQMQILQFFVFLVSHLRNLLPRPNDLSFFIGQLEHFSNFVVILGSSVDLASLNLGTVYPLRRMSTYLFPMLNCVNDCHDVLEKFN